MTADRAPRIVFRADASLEIGTGHVMRCLALADELRRRGAECTFVCRELPGHRIGTIRQRGFPVHVLERPKEEAAAEGSARWNGSYQSWLGVPPDADASATFAALGSKSADWLVVDHYALDARWQSHLRPATRKIMVIDDLADRTHDCELLLDQNLGHHPGDYEGLVPGHCERLCGPGFALLRPEFAQLRPQSLARRADGRLERILVTMGGIDKDNATGRVLEALAASEMAAALDVTVVMGSGAPGLVQVREQVAALPFRVDVAVDVADMAERMAQSDFAIGAAGSTSWERCCMGLPAALVVLADNQREACLALVASGAAFDLGSISNIVAGLPVLLNIIHEEPTILANMSRCAASISDGMGASRVGDALLGP